MIRGINAATNAQACIIAASKSTAGRSKEFLKIQQAREKANGRLAAKIARDHYELYQIISREAGNKDFIDGIKEAINEGLKFIK